MKGWGRSSVAVVVFLGIVVPIAASLWVLTADPKTPTEQFVVILAIALNTWVAAVNAVRVVEAWAAWKARCER